MSERRREIEESALLREENRLLLQLARLVDQEQLLDLLVEHALDQCPADGYILTLLDERQRQLVPVRARLPEGYQELQPVMLGFGYAVDGDDAHAEALRAGEPLVYEEGGREPAAGTVSGRLRVWGVGSVVVVPLGGSEGYGGTLMLLRRQPGWQTEELAGLVRRLELFLPQLGQVRYYAEVARREQAVARWADEQQRFLDFVVEANSLAEAEAVYRCIAEEFFKRYPFDLVGVLRRRGQHLNLDEVVLREPGAVRERLLEHYRDQPFWLGSADGATPLAFLQRSSFYFPDVQDVLDLPMAEKDRAGLEIIGTPRTFLIVPLQHRAEPIGVLWLMALNEAFRLSKQERQLIESLCAFLGSAVVNAELFADTARQWEEVSDQYLDLRQHMKVLDRLATRDRLTGLLNYGAFEQELELRVSEHERAPTSSGLSLLLVDVDHFKRFNDTYGHAEGNRVLQVVAERLQHLARRMDVVCRYGGEEFVLVLPQCEVEGARIIAERIRYDLEARPVYEAEAVTVSVGCASRRPGETARQLFERADQALYRAKRLGRNRVEG